MFRSIHKSLVLLLGLSLIFLTGCEQTAVDRAADHVRDESQQEADEIRSDSQEVADDMRKADGKTIFGAAETPSVERAADDIEQSGEETADAVEESGEARAEAIESGNDPS